MALVCNLSISIRSCKSGLSTTIWRSKRPARSNALSSTSGRLVAAITTTPTEVSKPSISVSNWFSVCSRSSCPPITKGPPRERPIASSSSIKMMQGALLRACSNNSRTRAAPTPTNNSINSEPLILKNGTLASPETARASKVFPVPGGPTSNTPLGIRPPKRWIFSGAFKKSMDSFSSCLALSAPATSAKVRLVWVS